jgi:DNA-binding transcriptional ArsR family regulator
VVLLIPRAKRHCVGGRLEHGAGVLKGLLPAPRTTTELARQLDLSPAAVSAHLSRLRVAQLVEPHRSGKKVYYRLSCAGESLLRIFGELE